MWKNRSDMSPLLTVFLAVFELLTECSGSIPTIHPNSTLIINEYDPLKIVCTGVDMMRFNNPRNGDHHFRFKKPPYSITERKFEDEHSVNYTITFEKDKMLHSDTGFYGCAKKSSTMWRLIYVYIKSQKNLFVGSADSVEIFYDARRKRNLTIPCRPTSPDYEVRLYKDDEQYIMGENDSYDPTEGFTIPPSPGRYKCEIQVNGSVDSNTFRAERKENPFDEHKLKVNKTNNYFMPNETVKYQCFVRSKHSTNITWTFQKDLQSKPQIFNTTRKTQSAQVYTLVLVVESSGYIACVACNRIGCNTARRLIFMSDFRDGIGVIVKAKTMTVNETISLICAASIHGYRNVRWEDSDEGALHLSERMFINQVETPCTNQAILTFNPLRLSDSGNYICRATSSFDSNDGEVPFSLTVEDPISPHFIETNMNGTTLTYSIETGSLRTAFLTCYVGGLPFPDITWWRGHEELDYHNQSRSNKCDFTFLNKNQELKFIPSHVDCSGMYTCKVKNRLGLAEAHLEIIIKGIQSIEVSSTAVAPVPTVVVEKHVFNALILVIAILVSMCIAFLVLVIHCGIKVYYAKMKKKQLSEAELMNFEEGAVESLNPELTVDCQSGLLPYDKKWEFPREKLKIGVQLGSGAFGIVMKTEAYGICEGEPKTTVAVKMMKHSSDPAYFTALISELKIMVHLGKHLNIVNLLGACTENISRRELLVIVEYCCFGNLRDYLLKHRSQFMNQINPRTGKIDLVISNTKKSDEFSTVSGGRTKKIFPRRPASTNIPMELNRISLSENPNYIPWNSNNCNNREDQTVGTISTENLLSWAFQVARGMEYLSRRKVLHGDLAARNTLLAENNVVKICDFGLAKALHKYKIYKKKGNEPLPMKWMAIESIKDLVFSTQSDVWSFGIVLWEFFTLAETPYPDIDPKDQYQKLLGGYRLGKPEFATDDIYNIMSECWKTKPDLRPTFSDVVKSIGNLIEDNVKMHLLNLNVPYEDMNKTFLNGVGNDFLSLLASPNHVNMKPTDTNRISTDCPIHLMSSG